MIESIEFVCPHCERVKMFGKDYWQAECSTDLRLRMFGTKVKPCDDPECIEKRAKS
jgi:hypothetical protein